MWGAGAGMGRGVETKLARPSLAVVDRCARHHRIVTEHLSYKNDLPGSKRAPCLGCGERVVTARDAHVLFGGKRDGSLLIAWDTEPQRSYATDVDRIYTEPDLFLLGVAHRDCGPLARRRLEAQQVELPDELPQLLIDEEVDDLPHIHLPPASEHCAFCGATDTTGEHVFPKWVSRELVQLAPLQVMTERGPRQSPSIEITVPVCEKCNNRWLSVLENDVQSVLRPLIRGEERTLTPGEQRLLATWAVKTALMLDLASGAPIIPAGFYYELRQLRTALPSQAVWLAAYLGKSKAIWAEHRGLHIGVGAAEPPNAFVTTFSVFRVVFQVVGHFTKGGATFDDSRLLGVGLSPIWPARDEAVEWPRGRLAFADDGLTELAASING